LGPPVIQRAWPEEHRLKLSLPYGQYWQDSSSLQGQLSKILSF
jgi:hypothetical protein